jgi:basic membrane protein A
VITQHQDCPKPILEVADRRGITSVGYHDDASKYKPNSWLTGAKWVWGPTMANLTMQALDGHYVGAQVRYGAADGIVDLSAFGPNVPEDIQKAVLQAKADIIAGKIVPFKGPIKDQAGNIVIKDGESPDTVTLENTSNFLVEGVIGQIPK